MSPGLAVFVSLLLLWVIFFAGAVSFGALIRAVEDRSPRLLAGSVAAFVVMAAALGVAVTVWKR